MPPETVHTPGLHFIMNKSDGELEFFHMIIILSLNHFSVNGYFNSSYHDNDTPNCWVFGISAGVA